MAKTLLEEMLDQTKKAKELIQENAKTILATTTKEVIKEALENPEELAEADEPDADYTETEATEDGEDIGDTPEFPAEDGEGTDETPDMPDAPEDGAEDVPAEITPMDTPEIAPIGDEEETLDLTGASYEEVMAAIENAPDDAKIVIVKKPAFDVSFEGGESEMGGGAEPPMVPDFDGEDEEAEAPDFDQETDEDEPEETEPTGDESDMDDDEDDDLEESMMESKAIRVKNNQLRLYEAKIEKLQTAVKILVKENATLKTNEAAYVGALNEAKGVLNDLSLTNVNLMHVTRLFSENTTTRVEKEEILKEFDNKVTTVNESKLMFESWSKLLAKSPAQKPELPTKTSLNETTVIEKKILKESKSFESAKLNDFDRIAGYKM